MKKADRKIVFDKYGGKCAYCGADLIKGWHVDHHNPVVRKQKFVKGYYVEIATGRKMTTKEINAVPETVKFTEVYRWVHDKWVNDGMNKPENDAIENYMPACASCNINKHSMHLEGFRETIKNFVRSLNLYSTQYKIAKKYGLISETENDVKFYFEKLNTEQNVQECDATKMPREQNDD